jgi:hypothetical protein
MLFACVGHVVTDDDFTPMMEAEADGDGYISLPEFTLAAFFNDIVNASVARWAMLTAMTPSPPPRSIILVCLEYPRYYLRVDDLSIIVSYSITSLILFTHLHIG